MFSAFGAASVLRAAEEAPANPTIPATTPGAAPKVDSGDNAWMLVSSALVLMMTGPGLALFYSGLVRKKNVLSVMMQCLFLMCLMTVIWALYGFGLSFGRDPRFMVVDKETKKESPAYQSWFGYIGDAKYYLFMDHVAPTWDESAQTSVMDNFRSPVDGAAMTVPTASFMLFQCMFFIITPALICGAFAERMKFSTMVVFMILWGTLIYCPLAHWVWGGGVLSYGSKYAKGIFSGGALDFAGGTVVHISSGVSALICALMLGKRLGYGKTAMPPHNLTYTAIGAAMLWVGWFGFNAGSAGNAGALASGAFMVTHFCAAAGGLTWAGLEWIFRGKPSVLGACSGLVAGLVCITPASGFVTPMYALAMGVAVACVCYTACTLVKAYFGYDDSLDAFGIHGVGGTLGALLTGVFATRVAGGVTLEGHTADKLGLIDGSTSVMWAQIVAVIITWILAAVGTFIILKILDAVMGLRVSREAEMEGLDVSQHDEEGYIFI
ncbi:MAG: ammonium transporter [Planctomycetota bacterium]